MLRAGLYVLFVFPGLSFIRTDGYTQRRTFATMIGPGGEAVIPDEQ